MQNTNTSYNSIPKQQPVDVWNGEILLLYRDTKFDDERNLLLHRIRHMFSALPSCVNTTPYLKLLQGFSDCKYYFIWLVKDVQHAHLSELNKSENHWFNQSNIKRGLVGNKNIVLTDIFAMVVYLSLFAAFDIASQDRCCTLRKYRTYIEP